MEVPIPSTDVQMAEHPNVGRNGFVDCSNLVVSRTDSFLYPRRSFTRIQFPMHTGAPVLAPVFHQ